MQSSIVECTSPESRLLPGCSLCHRECIWEWTGSSCNVWLSDLTLQPFYHAFSQDGLSNRFLWTEPAGGFNPGSFLLASLLPAGSKKKPCFGFVICFGLERQAVWGCSNQSAVKFPLYAADRKHWDLKACNDTLPFSCAPRNTSSSFLSSVEIICYVFYNGNQKQLKHWHAFAMASQEVKNIWQYSDWNNLLY